MKLFSKIFLIAALPVLFYGCTDDNDNGYPNGNGNGNGEIPGENEVWMENVEFVPSSLTVSTGTTVTWINKDNVEHTVTRQGMFDSGLVGPGETYTFTFNTEGTYDYVCTIHFGMEGTIVVEAGE